MAQRSAARSERCLPDTLPAARWMRIRAALGICVLGLILVLLAARLAQIQIVGHDRYAALADEQHVMRRTIGARRGDVRDAAGRGLATSVRVWSVCADPQAVANPEAAATLLAGVLELDRAAVRRKLGRPNRFVWIKRKVSDEQAAFLREVGLRGVSFRKEWLRKHPHGSVAAQVVGLTDVDGRGLSGVELRLDRLLRPRPGREAVAVDASRRVIRRPDDRLIRVPSDGCDVTLTVDSLVQEVAQQELAKAVEKHRPEAAWAVVLDARTGAVLAMANWPEFDPEDRAGFRAGTDRNLIVTDAFEFGSVMKPFTIASALDAGVVKPETEFFCHNGAWRAGTGGRGSRTVRDAHGYGTLTVSDILAKSSNIGIAQIGTLLGADRLHMSLRRFCLGEPTGIELPGETGGILRPLSRWTGYSVVSISFGQELASSPLSVATAFCAFANRGVLYRPQIIRRITDSHTGRVLYELNEPVRAHRAVSPRAAAQVLAMLRRVVVSGTGRRADLEGYPVAGKTGTAQLARTDGRGYYDDLYLSSFVGLAPAHEPRVCVLVSLKAPTENGYYGGTVAAPVVAKIIDRTLRYLEVPTGKRDTSIAEAGL